MPPHLERIDWMPSPPLAPDDGPIDTAHLNRMTLGDASLEREVLAMFSAQAVRLMGTVANLSSDTNTVAHTLKGSARAIGAFRVADAAEALETVARKGDDPAEALAELTDAVAEVRAAIDDPTRAAKQAPQLSAGDHKCGSTKLNQTLAVSFCLSMMFSQKPASTFPGHALARSGSTRYRTARTLSFPGSTSSHGQDSLYRPFRRNPHY
jgi:HPt (histidine-containing phosphotransfer) domain-containing protein